MYLKTKLKVKVVPGASRTRIAGWLGDELKVQLAAPPESGKANQALIQLLAESLRRPSRDLEIIHGATSSHKILEISGITQPTLMALITDALS